MKNEIRAQALEFALRSGCLPENLLSTAVAIENYLTSDVGAAPAPTPSTAAEPPKPTRKAAEPKAAPSPAPAPAAVVDAGTGQTVPVPPGQAETVTLDADAAKAAFVKLTQTDFEGAKALLAEFGAAKFSAIPDDRLAEFAGRVAALSNAGSLAD